MLSHRVITLVILKKRAFILLLFCLFCGQLLLTAQDTSRYFNPYEINKPNQKFDVTPWDSISAFAYQKHIREVDSSQIAIINQRIKDGLNDKDSTKYLLIDRCNIKSVDASILQLINLEEIVVTKCPELDLMNFINLVSLKII